MNDTTEALAAEAAMSRAPSAPWAVEAPTALLVLADGTVLQGAGVGAVGEAVGEVCFNTAMTGYQEILTDPSYMAQIVAFTFPHIGNVGTNVDDLERSGTRRARRGGARSATADAEPANWRADADLEWMKAAAWSAWPASTPGRSRAIREHGCRTR